MGKTKHRVDHLLAEELDLLLSPFTVTLKHIVRLNTRTGGFLFVQSRADQQSYHFVPVVSEVHGRPVKPLYFKMPAVVRENLTKGDYSKWYFCDGQYLYPLQRSKVRTLLESFIFKVSDNPPKTNVFVDQPESIRLRKKPRLEVRNDTPSWDEYLMPKLAEA